MPSLTMRKFSLSCSPLPQSVKSTSTQPSASRRNRADSRSRASAPSSPPVDSRARRAKSTSSCSLGERRQRSSTN